MRIVFTVQGQGRGHLTQAIAASEILQRAGHEIVEVVAGSHPGRTLPTSFVESFGAPTTVLPSPGFVFRDERGVDLAGTLLHTIRHAGDWARSLRRLRRIIEAAEPDLVVNFFEPLVGLLQAVLPLRVPVVAAAHQFALLGPRRSAPEGAPVAPLWLRAFIRFVGCRSWKVALSFTPHASSVESRDRIVVAAPLLRRSLFSLEPRDGDYVLVYVATHGYGEIVRDWHRAHPEVSLHCFYDRPGAPAVEEVSPNLTFHQLDPVRFLEMMAGCRVMVSSAGFESICEAAFLGKPVLMIPLEHHHEQQLNALDGEAAGVAVGHPVFDLDALARLPDPDAMDTAWFRDWCRQADESFLEILGKVVSGGERQSEAPRVIHDDRRA